MAQVLLWSVIKRIIYRIICFFLFCLILLFCTVLPVFIYIEYIIIYTIHCVLLYSYEYILIPNLNSSIHIYNYSIKCVKYTYIHAHIYTYIHTYIHTYMHTCIHAYTHTNTHTHTYTILNQPHPNSPNLILYISIKFHLVKLVHFCKFFSPPSPSFHSFSSFPSFSSLFLLFPSAVDI